MSESPSSPFKPFVKMHWALFTLINICSCGIFGIWAALSLTQQVAAVEPNARQRYKMYAGLGVGTLCWVCLIAGIIMFGFDGLEFITLGLTGRFVWTFTVRKSLRDYFAREQGRHFYPNGLYLLGAAVVLFTHHIETIDQAKAYEHTEDPASRYIDAVAMHPGLYLLVNTLTLFLYSLVVMAELTQTCQPVDKTEENSVNILWGLICVAAALTLGCYLVTDITPTVYAVLRVVQFVVGILTIVWGYKIRSIIVNEMARTCGFRLEINAAAVFFFPVAAVLFGVHNAKRQRELHEMTRNTAAQ